MSYIAPPKLVRRDAVTFVDDSKKIKDECKICYKDKGCLSLQCGHKIYQDKDLYGKK